MNQYQRVECELKFSKTEFAQKSAQILTIPKMRLN